MKETSTHDERTIYQFSESDSILPSQYFDRSLCADDPERRLMLRVLEDAVSIFTAFCHESSGRARRKFWEVERWFLNRDWDHLFSFPNVCACLSINEDYLRDGLWKWKKTSIVVRQRGGVVAPFIRHDNGTNERRVTPRKRIRRQQKARYSATAILATVAQ